MNREKIVPIVIIVVVIAILGAGGAYLARNQSARQQILAQMNIARPESGGLTASGFIEAEELDIAPEMGGRVVELLVDEGDEVEAGQVLLRLDTTLLEAQIAAAQTAVEVAQANLAQAQAGARPGQIAQAEAQVAQAEAARDGAYQAWQDLIAMRDNPQELNARIAQARAQVAAAEAALSHANALKDAAAIANDSYNNTMAAVEEMRKIPEPYRPPIPGFQLDFHLIPNNYWKAQISVNSAQAALDGARAALRDLYAMRDNPQELQAQIDSAKAQYEAAEAAVEMAQAQLDALKAGATAEELAVVEAQVQQAQAALDSLQVQRDKFTLTAPVGGLVLERSIHKGELAAPGATALTIGDLDDVTLTVYVPEDRLGQVHVGQAVRVSVDSFPTRTFTGTVVAIASEAEFTPRNVQTQEERVNMVFAVDISIPNPDHDLKPGMPADAVLVTEEE